MVERSSSPMPTTAAATTSTATAERSCAIADSASQFIVLPPRAEIGLPPAAVHPIEKCNGEATRAGRILPAARTECKPGKHGQARGST